jgi:hypothetical protein
LINQSVDADGGQEDGVGATENRETGQGRKKAGQERGRKKGRTGEGVET